MKQRLNITLFSLALIALASGCRTGTSASVQHAVAETSMASGSTGTRIITDADAGAVAHTINDGEIQMAQLALANASSQQVREFAQMLINDHQSGNRLLESNGYGVVKNPVTDVLNDDVNRRMASLRGVSGTAFDRAFLAHQVDLHNTALDTMKMTLQPSAQAQPLRQALTTMRSSVEMHLQHAKSLQGTFGR